MEVSPKIEKPIPKRNFYVVAFLFLFISLVFLGRIFLLEVIKASSLQEMAERARTKTYWFAAKRGTIFDRQGRVLARDSDAFSLVAIPAELPKSTRLLQKELKIIGSIKQIKLQDLLEKVKGKFLSYKPVLVIEDINPQNVLFLESQLSNLRGFKIQRSFKRLYPQGEISAHVVGYMGSVTKKDLREKGYLPIDKVGRSGIESFYEKFLKGNHGERKVELDISGREKRQVFFKKGRSGDDVFLTLDSSLQAFIFEKLTGVVKRLKARGGAVVILDPKSGAILALVNIPSFDNQSLTAGISAQEYSKLVKTGNFPFLNRAIAGLYPPGSTIKPAVAAAVLENNKISPLKKIFCSGKLELKSKFNPQVKFVYRDWKQHGWVNMLDAIAQSCDVYFYTVSGGYGDIAGVGIRQMIKFFKLFGLGAPSGLDLPGEAGGSIPSPERKLESVHKPWTIGDTYNTAIGQGYFTVTPLQIANYTAALANGGVLLRPFLLREITTQDGRVLKSSSKQIIRQNFISPKNLAWIREGMREAVERGTARLLKDLPFEVAGKTGTAQVKIKGREYYDSWFTAFAPFSQPRIVITVLVEDISNQPHRTSEVLKLAKETLMWYFKTYRQ